MFVWVLTQRSSVCTRRHSALTHKTISNLIVFRWISNCYCYKCFFVGSVTDKSPFRAAGGRNTPVGQRALTESNATDRTNKKESDSKQTIYKVLIFYFYCCTSLSHSVKLDNLSHSEKQEVKAKIYFPKLLMRSTIRWNALRRAPSCRYCPSLQLQNKTCPTFPLRGPYPPPPIHTHNPSP